MAVTPSHILERNKAYSKTGNGKAVIAALSRKYRNQQRCAVLESLGGVCATCGFSDYRALQVDHINGGGRTERNTMKNPMAYYNKVIDSANNNEGLYQLLCANCNQVKRYTNNEF